MFHWICPECGREIAPTVRECPACDAGAEPAELVLAGVVEASARTLNTVEAPARAPNVETSARTAHDDTSAVDRNRNNVTTNGVSANGVTADGDISTNSVDRDEPHAADTAVAWRSLSKGLEVPQESSSPSPDAPLIPEILDAKAAEVRAIEARVADLLGVLARPNDAREAQDARAVESKAVPTRTVEGKAVETRPIERKPVEVKAIESRLVESKVAESPVVGSKTAEPILLPAKFSRLTLPKIAALRSTALRALEAAADSKDEINFKTNFKEETGANAARADAGTETSPETKPGANAPVTTAASTAAHTVVNAAANTNIEPEAAAREPVLPSLVPPAPESLNALLAATGVLDDEPPAEPPDPPLSAKLPLPLRPAGVTLAAPAAPAATLSPASKAQPAPPPEAVHERGIAGLALVESPFPLGPISARPMKAAALAQPTAILPRSAGVRAPRSARPFLAPAMASLVTYSPLADHPLRPAAPPEDLRRTSTAPRITLPGPMLMRSLTSFQDRALAPIFLEERAFRKRFLSGWLATALVVGTVLGVGFSGLLSVAPRPGADARPAASAERSSSDASAADPANGAEKNPGLPHAAASNPLSKSIEVTGFRIVMDPSRKAEVQYLVVNHSPARFSDATVYVTLHAAGARPGQPPLCRFSFAAPNLGPFEAKEMISAIEKTNRPVNLPDWQALRADIEIGQ